MIFLNTIKAFLVGFFLVVATVGFSQSQFNTIDNQFDMLLSESNNYKTFKIIQLQSLQKLQQNTNDSLRIKQSIIDNKNAIVREKTQTIDSLNNELTTLKTEIDSYLLNSKQTKFLGLQFNQSTFQVIIIVIIVVLILLIIIFQYRYKSIVNLTRTSSRQLKEVENELEQFRTSSMEREQKLRRQLIDEVNKNKTE